MEKISFKGQRRGLFLILGLLLTIAAVSLLTAQSAVPSAAVRAAVANRAPARIIKDRFPAYAAVAVDAAQDRKSVV